MPEKITTLERARKEEEAGRLWRAKEILSGHFPNAGYSPELYAAYGRVLAAMHDSKEAGKYLFLSGLATQEEQELLDLYIESIRGKPFRAISAGFPNAAKRAPLRRFPERVRDELITLGFPQDRARDTSIHAPLETASIFVSSLPFIIFCCVAAIVIIGLINGISVIFHWLFGN